MMLAIAMANRNNADTKVPTMPPKLLNASKRPCNSVVATAIATVSATTIVEWPSEKNRPTPTGRRPSCINLRVTLSIAAM